KGQSRERRGTPPNPRPDGYHGLWLVGYRGAVVDRSSRDRAGRDGGHPRTPALTGIIGFGWLAIAALWWIARQGTGKTGDTPEPPP
ncbi:MAG: hypothetical protein ACETWR_22900, partial [Anaerolineae bacterium]